jgi:hypothetical protein
MVVDDRMTGTRRYTTMTRAGVVEVAGPDGGTRSLHVGERLVFGRANGVDRADGVDLPVGEDPWLSRRAGEISVLFDGVRVSNLSRKHALHVQLSADLLRLPAVTDESESADAACFLVTGVALVGSGAMLKQDRMIRVVLPDQWQADELQDDHPAPVRYGTTTQRPIRLRADTKDFMVAFLLCRPWLEDPTRMAPLPTASQIVEAALTITGAYHLLAILPNDPNLRERLSGQVNDHLKTLRGKLKRHRLVDKETSLTGTVIVSTLLHYDVIGPRHLALLNNSEWLSQQEDKWWGTT